MARGGLWATLLQLSVATAVPCGHMYAYARIHVYAYLGGLPYNYAYAITHICPSISPSMPSVTMGIRR